MLTEMTPRERVFAALERREPDRVPYFEGSIATKVIKGIDPSWDYVICTRELDLDVIGPGNGSDVRRVEWIDEETQTYRDQWGVIRRDTGEFASFAMEGPIKSPADLRAYRPPDPADDEQLPLIRRIIEENAGHRAVWFRARDGWRHAWELMGMEELLVNLIEQPRLVHDTMDMVVGHYLEIMHEAIRAGVDIVFVPDDYAFNTSSLMSPTHFREFILPRLERVVREAHGAGAYVVKHTDGNINELLDMIVGTGIDGLHPLEPSADMDIAQVKANYGDRICVMGNIDCAELLTFGNPEDVRAAVRECIRLVSPGGGHMVSSSNSVHPGVKPENFLAMVEATHEYGRYPINV